MALTKVTGQVIKNTTDVTVGVLTVTNTLAVGGTVSIGGTLTYEDVTNVDAVGLITARNGIVVGSGITLSKDGDVFFTGIITGNGSGLTNLATDLVNDTSPQLGGNLDVNTKNIVFGDSSDGSSDDVLKFGAGSDLSIYHDGSHSYITNTTGDLRITDTTGMLLRSNSLDLRNGAGDENYITCAANGAVELYYDNSKKFETTDTGVSITSKLTLPDGAGNGIRIGDSADLQAYHDGSASWIYENGTGPLNIGSNNSNVKIMGGGSAADTMAEFKSTEGVELYYNDSKTFETTSTGAQIENQLTVYGAAGNAGRILIAEGGAYSEIRTTRNSDDNGDLRFYTEISGSRALRMKLDYSGHLTPATNNTYDLGTSSLRWRNIYTTDLQLSNEGKSNDVDGTWGDYTIQEGESDLFLINNRSGKKYKFNLTEVS